MDKAREGVLAARSRLSALMSTKGGRVLLCVAALAFLCIFATGCRHSPVLEQIIYTQEASEVDYTQEMLDAEDEGEETNAYRQYTTEADMDRDTTEDAVHDEESSGSEYESRNLSYASAADSNGEAMDSSGGEGGEGEGVGTTGDTVNDDVEANPTEGEGGGTGAPTGGDDTNTSGTSDTPADDNSGNVTVDPDTDPIEETPTGVSTCTAVGSASLVVEMVAGEGALLGSSESFTGNALAGALFSEVSSGAVATWWQDNGEEAISQTDFEALLAAEPDACFTISGYSSFTSSQKAQLESAGIQVITLYEFSTEQNIKNNVQIVAEAFENDSIYDEYCSWVDEVDNEVSNQGSNNPRYGLYVVDWCSSVSYSFANASASLLPNGSSGSGMARCYTTNVDDIMSVYMNMANVTNESKGSVYHLNDQDADYVVVSSMFNNLAPSYSSLPANTTYNKTGTWAIGYDFGLSHDTDAGYETLGESRFPAVIAADAETATALRNDWFWQYHQLNSTGYFEIDGTWFYTSIRNTYSIYVPPTGVSSWSEGSIESPLLGYWVSNKVLGSSGISNSTMTARIAYFYKHFFGSTMSWSDLSSYIDINNSY